MKFQTTTVGTNSIILANDHYVAVPYNCGTLTALATNDDKAKGVLLSPVNLAENPNGTIVVHGFIQSSKLPAVPDAKAVAALKLIQFVD